MISCSSLDIRYGHETILENVNFEVSISQKLALLGPNGSGKTSLLRTLAGLTRPFAGHVFIHGEEIWPVRFAHSTTRSLYLNSHPAFLLDHSVLENLEYYCRCFHMQTTDKNYKEALAQLGLEKKKDKPAKLLSTGQKRKLTLACALLIKPHVLFADEPTNGLDTTGQDACFDIFNHLTQINNCTIVVATHDKSLTYWCDKKLDIAQFFPAQARRGERVKALL